MSTLRLKSPYEINAKLIVQGEKCSPMTIIGDSIIKYLRINRVFTQSIRGGKVRDMITAITHNIINVTNYHTVLVHVGTNDILAHTPEDILEDYKSLVKVIRSYNPGVNIVVSAVISRPCDAYRTQQFVVDFNKKLELYCIELRLAYVATYKKFKSQKLFAKDLLHLSQDGVAQLGRSLAGALNTNPL